MKHGITKNINRRNIMNYPIWFGIAAVTLAAIMAAVPLIRKFRYVFCVPEGWTGLVYHHGLYVRRNNAGRHILWRLGWTMHLVDLRKTSLHVPGVDFIMADNLCLKIGPHISYQITDPVKAAHETQHWPNELYHTALRALHAVLGGLSCEDLRHQRLKIAAQLLAQAQPEAARIGISILAIDLRYSISPLKPQTKPVAPEGHEA
jgi:regulator of protease activity HflC (stomatin/prohibitin superfamily)